MTKKEIVEILTERFGKEFRINKRILAGIVDCTFESFMDILAKEGRIEIRNFGVFNVKNTPARVGRNPLTKEAAEVPARNMVQFKAGKTMKDLAQTIPQEEQSSSETP